MQPSYGGVSEIPQFMVESSLFSISSSNPSSAGAAPSAATAPTDMATQHELKYHQLPHPHHPNIHHNISQPSPMMPHMAHFHSIPITQQLFQQPQHQFQLFHHHQHHHHHAAAAMETRRLVLPHQLGLDQDSGPENSGGAAAGGGGGGQHSFLGAPMSFKLAMNDSSGGGSRDMNEDDGDDGSESRLHHWQREDESAIKEPSWRPLDIDYINRNNKRCKDKEIETSTSNYCKKSKEVTNDQVHAADAASGAGGSNNYKVFSELEAIYKPGNGGSIGGGAIGPNQNQTGSGSALTGDETPIIHATTPTAAIPGLQTNDLHVGGSTETSAGEEAPVKKLSKGSCKRKRKRRRQQQQLSSIAAFFESLVKQLIEHQEALHSKFLEVMEKRDQERAKREEAWKKQESVKSSREAAARAQERALAASREDAIISFLEKITGESLNLPPRPQFSAYLADLEVQDDDNGSNHNNSLQIELLAQEAMNTQEGMEMNKIILNTSRWPKAEVQALIRVRSGLESRFQEPGLKGPLWDEVSTIMAAMGYQRSAKRCKEKWENINKYFRKTKESGKKRPDQSKTCPYFQQLDQLYSKSMINNKPLPSSDMANAGHEKHNSELLDAILGKGSNEASGSGTASGQGELGLQGHADNGNENNDDDEDENDTQGREREEGEGESQDHHEHQQQYKQQDDLHESALFFQRLQS